MDLVKIENETMRKKFLIEMMEKHAVALANEHGIVNITDLKREVFDTWKQAVDDEVGNLKEYLRIEEALFLKKQSGGTFTLNEGRTLVNRLSELQKPLVRGRNHAVGYSIRNEIIKEIMNLIE